MSLQFELGTMLFQLLAFIALMLLVVKFAFKPLSEMMKKREDHIQNQIESAEENRKQAEVYLEKQKKALEEARLEAKEMLERAKAQKEREAEEIIAKAQERAERMIQEATKEIEREKEKAIASLRDEVGSLSVQLAAKLLQKELDEKGQTKLVESYLEQVGRLQ